MMFGMTGVLLLMRRLILLIIFLLVATKAFAVADKYKHNPFTQKLDNVGNSNTVDTSSDCFSTDYCWVYEDSILKLYVNNAIQAQWPTVAIFDKLLLETGDYLLLENGDKLLLE